VNKAEFIEDIGAGFILAGFGREIEKDGEDTLNNLLFVDAVRDVDAMISFRDAGAGEQYGKGRLTQERLHRVADGSGARGRVFVFAHWSEDQNIEAAVDVPRVLGRWDGHGCWLS
jgi:hypothetical protein